MDAGALEKLCGDWAGVSSTIKWDDDLVFCVASKRFVMLCLHGPHRGRLSFKVQPERFLELSDQPGMMPAPYSALAFWISVVEPQRFSDVVLAMHVQQSYALVRAKLSNKIKTGLAAMPD
jgi:predicted DNA-binding protein (MmcQ/YjbR family)